MLPAPEILIFAAPAVLLAGLAKGGLGGAGGFAATPILALALPAPVAAGVMLPILMLMDALGLWTYRGRWSRPDAAAMMAASLVGIAIGWALFGAVSDRAIGGFVGAVSLLFALHQIARAQGWAPQAPAGGTGAAFPARRAAFWGAVAGFTSFVAHAGGPPAAMHLVPRRLDKTTYQATAVLVFWWINVAKLGPYLALGLVGGGNLTLSLQLAPLAVAGIGLGVWAHRRVPQRWFDRLVLIGVSAAGARLLWQAIAG